MAERRDQSDPAIQRLDDEMTAHLAQRRTKLMVIGAALVNIAALSLIGHLRGDIVDGGSWTVLYDGILGYPTVVLLLASARSVFIRARQTGR